MLLVFEYVLALKGWSSDCSILYFESSVQQFEQASSSKDLFNKIESGIVEMWRQGVKSEMWNSTFELQSGEPPGDPAHLQLAEIFWIKIVLAAPWVMRMVAHVSCMNVCVWITEDYLLPSCASSMHSSKCLSLISLPVFHLCLISHHSHIKWNINIENTQDQSIALPTPAAEIPS